MTEGNGDGGGGRGKLLIRIGALVVVVGLLVVFGREAAGYLPAFRDWVQGLGVWAPVVFVLGYAVATVAFIPGSLLTLAGGAIFGLAQGTALVFVGASLGATGAFLASRYLVRVAIEKRVAGEPRFAAIDAAIGRQGFKIVFLLRLTPVVPFILLNYALGLTKVKLSHYVAAFVGMLPATLLYVYYGAVAGELGDAAAGQERGLLDYALMGAGLVATVAVVTIISRIASRAFKQELGE